MSYPENQTGAVPDRATERPPEEDMGPDTVRAAVDILGAIPGRQLASTARAAHDGIADAQFLCHSLARYSGWWNDLVTEEPIDANDPLVFGQKIALIHSEVSEALEGHRKGKVDDHLQHRDNAEVELADALIRILDLAGAMRLDLAGAVVEKLAVNQQRADHKLENRRAADGKTY